MKLNLRRARFDDHWKKTFSRVYPARLEVLKFRNLLCLTDGEIEIPSGICAVVGGNGVGKSALLAAVSELLADPEVSLGVGHKSRLRSSELDGTATDPKGKKELAIREEANGARAFTGEKFEAEFYWLEPSYLVNIIHKQVNEDQNFTDLLEPLSAYTLNLDELEILRYLLGKKIDSCEIYEVAEYGGLDPFPYFIANSGGKNYGSERMGYGELSLMLILWKLRTINKNSVLVLEEPETHVSPRSQRALMDILAKSCNEKGISIVLTTHSPAIISKIPIENIILISKNGNGTTASIGPSKSQVNELLGQSTQKRALILVEDRAALQFTVALLREINLELFSQVEVVNAVSNGRIDTVITTLPKSQTGWLNIIGLYDGDQRGTPPPQDRNWPHIYLPGSLSPEISVKNLLFSRADGIDLLAIELNKLKNNVDIALETVDGMDVHDWYTQLPELLGCDHQTLMSALVRIWLLDNKDSAETFNTELIEILNH